MTSAVAYTLSVTVGCILAIAAVAKWSRPAAAIRASESYANVPRAVSHVATRVLLVVESSLAVMLVLGGVMPAAVTRIALLMAAVLFVVFIALVVRSRQDEEPMTCGCLGDVVELRLGLPSVAMNIAVVIAAIVVAGSADLSHPTSVGWLVVYECAILLSLAYWLVNYGASVRGIVAADMRERALP